MAPNILQRMQTTAGLQLSQLTANARDPGNTSFSHPGSLPRLRFAPLACVPWPLSLQVNEEGSHEPCYARHPASQLSLLHLCIQT